MKIEGWVMLRRTFRSYVLQRYRYAKLLGTEMAIGQHSLWTSLFIIKIGVLYRNLHRKESSSSYKCTIICRRERESTAKCDSRLKINQKSDNIFFFNCDASRTSVTWFPIY